MRQGWAELVSPSVHPISVMPSAGLGRQPLSQMLILSAIRLQGWLLRQRARETWSRVRCAFDFLFIAACYYACILICGSGSRCDAMRLDVAVVCSESVTHVPTLARRRHRHRLSDLELANNHNHSHYAKYDQVERV